jgi:hypothetical protein
MNYVVEISTDDGTPVFKGTVSQKGDFVHLHTYPHGTVATLRVHDMLAASAGVVGGTITKTMEPVMVDPPADQSWLKMENA